MGALAVGCGEPPPGNTGGGGSGGTSTASPTTSSSEGGGGTGGGECLPDKTAFMAEPWDVSNCDYATVAIGVDSMGQLVVRIPGWKLHGQEFYKYSFLAADNDLGIGCDLNTDHYLEVGAGADYINISNWQPFDFNPGIPPDANENNLVWVNLDIPLQSVQPGEDLFLRFQMRNPEKKGLCMGGCDGADGYTWLGSGNLDPYPVQMRAAAGGDVLRDCHGGIKNSPDICKEEDVNAIGPLPSEDGDYAVEELTPEEPVLVDEITVELDRATADIPAQVELIYELGVPGTPPQTFTLNNIPGTEAYLVDNGGALFAVMLADTVEASPTSPLFAGIVQHTDGMNVHTGLMSCKFKADGSKAYWGDAHSNPGTVKWDPLGAAFPVNYRVKAFYKGQQVMPPQPVPPKPDSVEDMTNQMPTSMQARIQRSLQSDSLYPAGKLIMGLTK